MSPLSAYLERVYIDDPQLFIRVAQTFGVRDVEVKSVSSIRDRARIMEQVERLIDAINREINRYSAGHDGLENFIDYVLRERVEGYKDIYSLESKLVFLAENKEKLKRSVKSADLKILIDKLSVLGEAVRRILEMHMEETWKVVQSQVARMKVKEEWERKKKASKAKRTKPTFMERLIGFTKKSFVKLRKIVVEKGKRLLHQ